MNLRQLRRQRAALTWNAIIERTADLWIDALRSKYGDESDDDEEIAFAEGFYADDPDGLEAWKAARHAHLR